jgi:hypothetical protein
MATTKKWLEARVRVLEARVEDVEKALMSWRASHHKREVERADLYTRHASQLGIAMAFFDIIAEKIDSPLRIEPKKDET